MRRLVASALMLFAASGASTADGGLVPWRRWSDAVFEQAKREDRLILLHMAAVWCHWCHVMEATTYRDPAVLSRLAERFIPVRVDQDADPALSYRYEHIGWPGSVILDGDGNEVLKRRGYVSPELFLKLLDIAIEDPSAIAATGTYPEPQPRGPLAPERRAAVEAAVLAMYDGAHGGFGDVHRFLQAEALELALARGRAEPRWSAMARLTLANARALIDPVWGGMYQYSDALDWSSPHYEKIMVVQSSALRLYALAYARWGDPADLEAARAVRRFLRDFLRAPEGAYWASADADAGAIEGKAYFALDDAGRRRLGLPRVDRNLYAREQGWAASGLAALHDVDGEPAALAEAVAAVEWAIASRRTPTGAFGHGSAADADAYLADSLAMAEAFLALWRSTGERRWLAEARATAEVILERFSDAEAGGFMAQRPPDDARGAFRNPVKQFEENVATVRLLNLLAHYYAEPRYREAAERGLAFLAGFAEEGMFVPGALLADAELAREPPHIAVVGRKDDPEAARLYAAARSHPTRYLRIEWWDRREGPLPNPDVRYPELDRAAAFACANGLCSLPAFAPEELGAALAEVDRR